MTAAPPVLSYADRLALDGFFVIEGLLAPDHCADIFAEVLEALSQPHRAYVHEGRFRAHCPLALSPSVERAVHAAVGAGYEPLDALLRRRKSLVELSSITVFPGAACQPLHCDASDPERYIASVFINVFPTARGVGPLCVVPGSHSGRVAADAPRVLELPPGSAVFMDGKLRHAGTENSSTDRIRPVFYFSFGDDDIDGPTYSLRPEYRRRYQLSDFRRRDPDYDSHPRFRGKRWVAVDLATRTALRRVVLMNDSKAEETLDLPQDPPWIADLLELVGRLPGKLSAEGLAIQLGVSLSDVLEVLREFNELGLLEWGPPEA
jgi:hypothetical protein